MAKLIIANWKSYKSIEQAQAWLQEYHAEISSSSSGAQVVVLPAFPLLSTVADNLQSLQLGTQDISPFPAGAYTGAVSTENLAGLPVKYALLGHSERRRYFHETHMEVANKVDLCLSQGITPIVCVDDEYINVQAAAISESNLSKCMVAYEALESIGSGLPQPISKIKETKDSITNVFGPVPVIYGGSVSSESAAEYLLVCDGVLVATHSLEAKDFARLVMTVT
ncbi:MAG: triose-phosphate isomerase [bacterium]|nr:triose-phosphate isomerase [bacterium]